MTIFNRNWLNIVSLLTGMTSVMGDARSSEVPTLIFSILFFLSCIAILVSNGQSILTKYMMDSHVNTIIWLRIELAEVRTLSKEQTKVIERLHKVIINYEALYDVNHLRRLLIDQGQNV